VSSGPTLESLAQLSSCCLSLRAQGKTEERFREEIQGEAQARLDNGLRLRLRQLRLRQLRLRQLRLRQLRLRQLRLRQLRLRQLRLRQLRLSQ
jgi:uncharacterized protein YjbI with pentapeptide repeats